MGLRSLNPEESMKEKKKERLFLLFYYRKLAI
jgi:hypothetical protein